MTDQERQQIDQAIEQLRKRSYELVDMHLAHADQPSRMIDDLHAAMVVRFTTPAGAAERARRCR